MDNEIRKFKKGTNYAGGRDITHLKYRCIKKSDKV